MSASGIAGPRAAHARAVGAAMWRALRGDAERIAAAEPLLAPSLRAFILERASFADALAATLAARLAGAEFEESVLRELAAEVMTALPELAEAAAEDLAASIERNPAYPDAVTPFCYAKGFHALQWHRIAHVLWMAERRALAAALEGRANDVFAIDIHPAARIGVRVFIDHGTGVVIGETAVVGDDVSILHEVTLGGTGKDCGDRHPKVAGGVLLSAGAKILGNVTIGEDAKVGAGSVVVKPVAAHTTVAGVPAQVVGRTRGLPAEWMDQSLDFQI